ncbi:peptidyl-prolyl cis-trans isomerase [Pontixanthobacter sp.]|uniref:peptidylprolyl isomerase n=1 Tax=Pontixanthobacter sp. TaxID=2792078 RepID=UPI003C7CD6D1
MTARFGGSAGWMREPLVHFLLAGAVLFAFFAWKGAPADPSSRDITISREDRAQLALQWQRTMQRAPTDAELDSLTQTWLREEVLYREALRLGLERDDAVVRKRLANKMEYLATSIAETVQPRQETLENWLADNPQRFAQDTRYSFDQLYFAEKTAAEAAANALASGADWARLGENISLPQTAEAEAAAAVEKRFGSAFVDQLNDAAPGSRWRGPVPSGFGWHLVRLRMREAGIVPPLADIRGRVENDWRNQTLATRRDDAYQLLRSAYRVEIQK